MKKTISYKRAKERAWKAFSLFIRRRDAIETTGTIKWGVCCTCGRVHEAEGGGGKCLQAGHFVGGRRMSILFDEFNVHAQCYACNVIRRGNLIEYYRFMMGRYGQEEIDRLVAQERRNVKLSPLDLLEIEAKYLTAYEALAEKAQKITAKTKKRAT